MGVYSINISRLKSRISKTILHNFYYTNTLWVRRRHMVRIYMRDRGPRYYLGDEATPRPGTSTSL